MLQPQSLQYAAAFTPLMYWHISLNLDIKTGSFYLLYINEPGKSDRQRNKDIPEEKAQKFVFRQVQCKQLLKTKTSCRTSFVGWSEKCLWTCTTK